MPVRFSSAVVHTAAVTLIDVPEAARDEDLALLSAEERRRAERFAVEPSRAAYITARAALRRQLGKELSCDADAIAIDVDERGRPFLVDAASDAPDFNLSHSGALIAIAIARGGRVGVDVEWHGRNRGLRELVPQVMGEREAAYLNRLDGQEFKRAFFDCWTRKEALLKAHGIGIAYPLRSIDIPMVPAGRAQCADLENDSVWSVWTSAPRPGYTLSVALAGAPLPESAPGELDAAAASPFRIVTS
jgi:4'-phosphopantetheinyl transferase